MDVNNSPFAKGLFSVLQPIPSMDLAEWSEKYRVLSGAGTNEKGMWRNARTPYLVEIMKELSPQSRTKEVVVMKGIQLGFSEIAVSWSFYNMHLRPGPFLYMMPSEDMAYKLSKQRLSPSLEQCEVLRDKLNKMTGNSYLEKLFNGRIDGSTTELGSGFEVRGKSGASPVTTGEVGLTHRSTPTDEAFPSAWVQLEEVMKRKLVRSDGREIVINV